MPANTLSHACKNHPEREASAKCPECGSSFCRECITEHDFRMICAGCLAGRKAQIIEKRSEKRRWHFPLVSGIQYIVAIFVVWFVFYLIARALLAIPADMHEGKFFENLVDKVD